MTLTRERRTNTGVPTRKPRAASADDERAVERLEVRVDRGRRQAVAVAHLHLRPLDALLGEALLALVGERAAGVGPLEEEALVGRARGQLDEAEPRHQLLVDLGHDRVLGGGVIGAKAQQRVGAIARAGAADADARRRRAQHRRPWRRRRTATGWRRGRAARAARASPSSSEAARLSPSSASVVRTSRSMRERSRSGSIGRRFYHKWAT